MPDPLRYTVSICTRNRADMLKRSIEAALKQRDAPEFEVLVVDNQSEDGTPAVVESYRGYPNVRGVHEKRLGLSCARNRALQEARGEIIVYADDDATLCVTYLASLDALWRKEAPAVAGGPIAVDYLDEAPAWWEPVFEKYCGAFCLGGTQQVLHFSRYPQGANIALDRCVVLGVGGFNEALGVGPRGPWAGEEIELCARLDAAGAKIVYHPDLHVTHHVRRRGRTRTWLLRTAFYRGRSHFHATRGRYPNIRWRSFARQLIADTFRSFPGFPIERLTRWLTAFGMLTEANMSLFGGGQTAHVRQ